MQERLQKFISQAGVASRRRAEELIVQGKVKVNGRVVRELGTKVEPNRDRVEVDGNKIETKNFIYLVLNKPRKYVTTRHDPEKRKTVYDLLPAKFRIQLWTVGRLDYHTEGLLLFTNDGDLTQALTHPSNEHEKEYEVELDKEISEGKLAKIENGVMLDGKMTAPAKARVAGKIVYVTIHEGWKRQVRRMFSVLGYTVRNLKRIRIGKLKLAGLELGQYKVIDRKDVI
ncbi:MAG TPA: pseudouridine synthase [Patescibacteria group bacterium]|jgi:pseudouridine synthase|nr:pseudouridine synthase [Patescibacteria group bacterium]